MGLKSPGGFTAQRHGDRLVIRDRYVPNPKQGEFHRACATDGKREILFDGSLGFGKTQAGCKQIVAWAMKYGRPGQKYLVARKTYLELEDTTKAAMVSGDGGMPPALPRGEVDGYVLEADVIDREYAFGTFNKVVLRNGAEILFRSLEPEHHGKIKNLTLAGFLIDQAEELDDDEDEEFVETLVKRMRDPHGPCKGIFLANPGPEEHWLARRFGVLPEYAADMTRHEKFVRARVHGTLFDNVENLPPAYVADMLATKDTRPDFYRRYVLGEWGAFGGKRFKGWDRRRHVVRPFDIPDEWEILAGLDYGSAAPTAYLSIAISLAGRWHVVGEHYAAEQTISHHAGRIKLIEQNPDAILGFYAKLSPSVRWLDPSAWRRERREFQSVAMEFTDHGIHCAKAQNDRLGGWNRIEEMLMNELPDGGPELVFFENCPNVIREVPNLKYKVGTDDVEKVNDHAADALRYPINSRTPTPLERIQTPVEAHTREEVAKRIVDRVRRLHEQEDVEEIGVEF